MTTKTERVIVNAWIDPEVAARLDAMARAADRSRSAEIRLALREHVDRREEDGDD